MKKSISIIAILITTVMLSQAVQWQPKTLDQWRLYFYQLAQQQKHQRQHHHSPTPTPSPTPSITPRPTPTPTATPTPSATPYAIASDGTPLRWITSFPKGTGPWPGVAVIHGGNFYGGGPEIINIVKQALNDAGFACYSLEYRLAPQGSLPGQKTKGQYPDQTDDIALGLDAIAKDPNCTGWVGMVGGSAGGYQVAWQLAFGRAVCGVAISPAMQLDDPSSLQDSGFNHSVNNYAPGHLADASPDMYILRNGSNPCLMIYSQFEGTPGFTGMPQGQFVAGKAAYAAANAPFEWMMIPNSGLHSFDNWPVAADPAVAFLLAHLEKPTPTPTPSPSATATPTPTPTATPSPSASPTPIMTSFKAPGLSWLLGGGDYITPQLAALKQPYVKLIRHRLSWKSLEPTRGTYSFAAIQKSCDDAAAAGKGLTVGVTGLIYYKDPQAVPLNTAPDWLKADGAKTAVLTTTNGMGDVIWPMDETQLTAYCDEFWPAFGKAIGNKPALKAIYVGNIGQLNESYVIRAGAPQSELDAFEAAGGTEAWIAAASRITDAACKAFPDKAVYLTIAPPIPGDAGFDALDLLAAKVVANHPGQVGFENAGWNPNSSASYRPDGIILKYSDTQPAALQCGPPTGFTESDLPAAIAAAKALHIDSAEMYPGNLNSTSQAQQLTDFAAAISAGK